MSGLSESELRDLFLSVVEESLNAQLKAIRKLRGGGEKEEHEAAEKRTSQTDLARDVLMQAGIPLHIDEIMARVEKQFGVVLERDSIVSAISKKINRQQTFRRCGRSVFGLREE